MAKLQTSEEDKLIGKRTQQKRKEKGFSAAFLSEQLNLSQQQLSRYETGSNKINVTHLIEIADYLETPISWFFWIVTRLCNHFPFCVPPQSNSIY